MKRKTVNKTLCGALTAIMLISLLMMPQAVNALEPTNLCLGKTATATAQYNDTTRSAAMAIDGNSRKRALYWFPYSTLSASSDGSGWYCMPEVGDDVRIYFPSKAESEAIALSAVSNYDAPQSGEDRMSDPDNRYLRTKSGQELALAPGYIKLSCGKAASAVTIQTDGKVKIQSQSMVKAMAQEEIAIHAEEQVTLHVSEQFIMHSLSGGQIVSSKGNVIMQGTEVIVD